MYYNEAESEMVQAIIEGELKKKPRANKRRVQKLIEAKLRPVWKLLDNDPAMTPAEIQATLASKGIKYDLKLIEAMQYRWREENCD